MIKERVAEVLVAEGFLRELSAIEVGDGQDGPARVAALRRRAASGDHAASSASASPSAPHLRRRRRRCRSVRGGMGITIVSTPLGVLVDREAARRNVGGELLCSVW